MKLFGLETFINSTLVDVEMDRDFDMHTDVITLKFDDGRILQFWAIERTSNEEGTHPELQYHVSGYEGIALTVDPL